MSPYPEFEGKTIEKALINACETLNVSRDKLKYDVLSYGSSGIFGLVGVKKARIRITSPKPRATEIIPETTNSEEKFSPVVNKKGDAGKSPVTHLKKEESEEMQKAPEDSQEPQIFPENPLELGRSALQRIIDFITTDAKISVKETPERIFFNVEGGNTAVLIGKRGQTLEAIQYLVEKIINKHNAHRIRIQVDIEGYLDNRKAKLEGLAARLSEKAKRIGKPVTIGQLNAHDRRIVHIALKDDNEVRTQSMGDGFYRKLVIFPQRRFHRRKENLGNNTGRQK
ncbi:RNA-binding cell elongation regulator Jag/EloR [Desulfonema magnum]|uniref:RNA-binding protein KhpB n=1 Tax=Desulfonema magnum TaxID=45655 RepID=A0A975GT60_9BACT|nr:RNA-binding cell elongation regulator Jag/EloR [Desulfonema magnum]QTA92744.1 R3H domain-containing protein [Desulfonema magnum]